MFDLYIIWGESPEHGDRPLHYKFNTAAERTAFLRGVDEAVGWADCHVCESSNFYWDSDIGESVKA